jgi:hypothetical protein
MYYQYLIISFSETKESNIELIKFLCFEFM